MCFLHTPFSFEWLVFLFQVLHERLCNLYDQGYSGGSEPLSDEEMNNLREFYETQAREQNSHRAGGFRLRRQVRNRVHPEVLAEHHHRLYYQTGQQF
jgi:hypothetical protein